MAVQKLFDLHVHSDNSPDGDHSITVLCEHAVKAGLRAIAITDHCECNLYHSDHYDRAIRQSYFESVKAKSLFAGELLVLCGVELGQPLQGLAAARDALAVGDFDFVLCSLHNIAGKPDFYYIRYDDGEHEPYSLLERHFSQLLEMVRTLEFDSLGHLTYPLRYMIGTEGLAIDLSRLSGVLDEILGTLAARNKALEINVSGLRGPFGRTMPEADLVRRFLELGGQFITIGSDAHRAEHVGANLTDGIEIARNAGFTHITLFEKREPILIPIQNTSSDNGGTE